MSDQDKPSFNVVDKRRATQEETSSDGPPTAAAEPEAPSPPTTDDTQQSAEAPGDPATEAPEDAETSEPDEDHEHTLPDPALLLSMAAMHLDTQALISALLAVFDGHAWRSLGLVAHPATGEVNKDLPSAQLAIDCVQFLFSRVENSLPASDRHDLQRRISDLRMNYLAKLREP